MTGEMVPFGKYKGQPVEIMAADADYCEWLTAQSWFRERYGNVYNTIINYGTEPQDSPEHNEMQARYLDGEWCLKLAAILVPSLADSYGEDGALKKLNADPLVREFAACCKKETISAAVTKRAFEVSGWDVTVTVTPARIAARVVTLAPLPACICECDHSGCPEESTCHGGSAYWRCPHRECPEQRGTTKAADHCTEGCPWHSEGAMQQNVDDQPDAYKWWHARDYRGGYSYATKADWLHYGTKEGHSFSVDRPPSFLVELKPDLGDDYPAVLRQVSGYKGLRDDVGLREDAIRCVVARRHTFERVTWEQVKKIFAASNIRLLAESEIEAAGDPERRVLALLEQDLGAEVIPE